MHGYATFSMAIQLTSSGIRHIRLSTHKIHDLGNVQSCVRMLDAPSGSAYPPHMNMEAHTRSYVEHRSLKSCPLHFFVSLEECGAGTASLLCIFADPTPTVLAL